MYSLLAEISPAVATAVVFAGVIAMLMFWRSLLVGKTHFPAVAGNQYSNSNYNDGRALGNIFYVCSIATNASNVSGNGFSPEAPFATIAYAIAQCTANNDDLILVLPGHVETLTAAGTVTVSVAGVTIRGVPPGGISVPYSVGSRRRATINYTTGAAASFNITAANVTIDNLFFNPINAGANVTAAVNVSAADASIVNCEFYMSDATTTFGAAIGILTTAAANRLLVKGCHFHDTTTGITTAVIKVIGGDSIRIEDNVSMCASTTSLGFIQNVTTATTNINVLNNIIANKTASSTVCATFVASTSTGCVCNNRFSVLSGTAPVVGTGLFITAGNYYQAAAGAGGGTLL